MLIHATKVEVREEDGYKYCDEVPGSIMSDDEDSWAGQWRKA